MWATIDDLFTRYGEEYVNKLAVRRNYDKETKGYIADESCENIKLVLCTALEDARDQLEFVISKCYNIKQLNEFISKDEEIKVIKRFHLRMAIAILKEGGDCEACDACEDKFYKICSESKLCTESGLCLTKNPRIYVTEYCDPHKNLSWCNSCGCDDYKCRCKSGH